MSKLSIMAIISPGKVIFLIGLKILLPTLDVYSDIGTAHQLLNWENTWFDVDAMFKFFGSCTITFIILTLLLTIPHFLRHEKTLARRLKTLPFLLTLTWPQFKAFEVLWTAFVLKDVILFEHRLYSLDIEISQVGKYFWSFSVWSMIK